MKTKLLVESWRSFLNEEDQTKPTTPKIREEPQLFSVGLVSMSAKPFHKGHMFLIQKAAEQCNRVIVYVSITDRSRKGEITIHGEDMQFIWKNIITDYLPGNVECIYGGSPVGGVYKFLGDISELGIVNPEYSFLDNIFSQGITGKETYAIYTGKDDASRYQDEYYENIKDRVWIKSFERGDSSPDISGTLMRSYLSNASQDKLLFLDGLPVMEDEDKEEIFNILFRRLN
jgi:cytidyltransferase-like protein